MFNGITDVLADILRADVVSQPASAWVEAYPTFFAAGASSVPEYLYKSLKDIWLPGSTITQWENAITSVFGLGYSGSRTIDVTQVRSLDQADFPKQFPQGNDTGSDGTEVHVYLKLPDNVQTANSTKVAMGSMRVRKLLDHNWRTNYDRQVIVSTNPMIRNDRPIWALWQGFVSVEDIKSIRVIFYVFYTNLVLPNPQ